MRTPRILYVTILIAVVLSTFTSVWLHDFNQGKDLLLFTISAVGFCVAILALFIAVRTYTSIDSVNNISKMDGNILDNPNYVTSLPELISEFKSQTPQKLSEIVFDSMETKLKKSSGTAVLFADTLQYMIDLIVLFPAVFNASKSDKEMYKKRMDKILKEVDRRRDILNSVTRGSYIQISETIKLLKAVVSYQNLVSDGNFNIHSDLLHVRGPILRNPVTKTIYHNYLGLYYNKKAMHLLQVALSDKHKNVELLSINGLELVQDFAKDIPPTTIENIVLYLKSACEQFDKALSVANEDAMWPGFINYNKARCLYFLNVLTDDEAQWDIVLDSAINSRSRLNKVIDEVLTYKRFEPVEITDTHLRQFFIFQEELARLMKLNFTFVSNTTATSLKPLIYKGNDLKNISQERFLDTFTKVETFADVKKYEIGLYEALFDSKDSKSVKD